MVGVLVSSAAFAAVHLSTDIRLNIWYLTFAVGTALVTWRSGGIETAVVLHASFNTLTFVFDAALRTDFSTVLADPSSSGTVGMLVPGVVVVITALAVWLRTRSTGPARTPGTEAAP